MGTKGYRYTAEQRERMSAAQRKQWASLSEDERRERAQSLHTAEARAKISASNSGRTHTEQSRKNMSEAHLGYTPTAETRAKLSAAARRRDPAIRALVAEKNRGQKRSPEARARMAAASTQRGKPPPRGTGHGKGSWFVCRRGRRIWMRSTWEVEVAKYLDAQEVDWEYEPRRFDLGDHTYCPDFWIEDWGCFWEVKGYFGEKAQRTTQKFRELNPGLPLVVVDSWVYKLLIKGREDVA